MSTSSSPPQSSLPEPSYTGPFTAYVSIDIDAPVDKVWAVLADFTKYPEWYVPPSHANPPSRRRD